MFAVSQRGSLTGAQHFLKKYVKDLEKEKPCCPLCHREFDTDQEVKELVLEVSSNIVDSVKGLKRIYFCMFCLVVFVFCFFTKKIFLIVAENKNSACCSCAID